MKNVFNAFVILTAFAVLAACSSKVGKPAAATAPTTSAAENGYISGQVKEVQLGKDGYTAKLETSDHQVYFATISRANLQGNAHQYRAVQVGETLTVKGEVWKMGDENRITVRELK